MDLLARARDWLSQDPDPVTRDELQRLLDAEDMTGLEDRFRERLQFGTAGLRGALGAGPNRMNRAVVIRAAAGLTSYVRDAGGRAVVIGFDARHKSDQFARDTAAVVEGAGLRAMVLPEPLPTPVLAFAIRYLGADAGVMVTASHNPPQDNGYKVYLGDGSQIVPPADGEISARIDAVGRLADVPLGTDWITLDEEVVDAYVRRTAAVAAPDTPRDLRVVYTPLHGTGRDVLVAVLGRAGFAAPDVVPEQAEPDPEFPTVAFPNPEEPGAMDLALARAVASDADLVIANDPDADRCAVAVPDPASGGWRMLRGDDVGALLGAHLVRSGRAPAGSGVFATTIVSSTLLGRIAAKHGLGYTETLTGFKWLSRVPRLRYGYEEALGYCVDPDTVRDKDGISAALLVCELAASLRAAGAGLPDLLDELAAGYGVHATDQLSIRVDDLAEIDAMMTRLSANPPADLGGRAVESVEDLTTGSPDLPPTDGLRYRLAGGAWVVVRPSGTEPKLKCYAEVVVPVTGSDVTAAREQAAAELAKLRADLAAATGARSHPPS
ncbi:phospho-sugar mutase [Aeromicrobium sp.]|uniref:phospho-sugar mutase n=1 Tax=Aeromicrobium sp. TaxID=1871063 RepID=UPI003D6A8835